MGQWQRILQEPGGSPVIQGDFPKGAFTSEHDMIHTNTATALLKIYSTLLDRYGNRGWWPADTPFETIIGAILAQNVSWSNARKAVENLKAAGLLDVQKLRDADHTVISQHIISSRYYNQKAQRISAFMQFLDAEYGGDLDRMSGEDHSRLRVNLLSLKGFGEETVDSILLYACNVPVFVVDAYTKRIFSRYGFLKKDATYQEVQHFFTTHVPKEVPLYNDYHAQIVNLGHSICTPHPDCHRCPIRSIQPGIACEYANTME